MKRRMVALLAGWLFLWVLGVTAAQAATWPYETMPITWYVTYTAESDWGGRSEGETRQLIQDALKIWSEVDCSFVVFKFGGLTRLRAGNQDGKNVITWIGAIPGVS